MSEPFIAEIRIFAGNFAPRGWAFCDGQLLPIAQNTALFSLIGTTYGGDGRTTTALPDLQGRAPMHPGSGPGLTTRRLGEQGGTDPVTLSGAHMPAHTHNLVGSTAETEEEGTSDPTGAAFGTVEATAQIYGTPPATVAMSGSSTSPAGGGQPHNNRQPFLGINFIIALQGIYPSRS